MIEDGAERRLWERILPDTARVQTRTFVARWSCAPTDIAQEATQPERLFFPCERISSPFRRAEMISRILLRDQFLYLLLFRADSAIIVPLHQTFISI